ncbi:RmlC-like cupin domain superfamily [Sesbania bispinosa]|nr:RmlC-like cupin domain superfamily [Sesbania bispinosa]
MDIEANLVRFLTGNGIPSRIVKDNRGWLLDPLSLASASALSGGAVTCASIHVGEIRPGRLRGNHRHHDCNETLVIWGAATKFRLENSKVPDNGYAEVTIGSDDIAVAASPSGTAHAIVNIDQIHSTFFIGCQDSLINYNASSTDFNVWKDL